MRVDKFLKVSRILKRRSVANNACALERVFVNEKTVKPSFKLKIGDKVKILFGQQELNFVVKKLDEKVSKEDAQTLYEIST